MTGRTIAICNQKGGVGKTTTAVNLSAALALLNQKALLVDLDPQGNATGGIGVERQRVNRSVYDLLLEADTLESVTVPTQVTNLSLIPSNPSLSGAEVELVNVPKREERLKSAIGPAKSRYSFLLIDCPPSLGLLTVNALVAADSVLIPLQCEYYALEGLSQLLKTIELVRENLNPALAIEGVVLTMADFRTKLTQDVIQEARRFFGDKVYDAVIPRSVRLSEAPSYGLPIALYDPNSIGAKGYRALAEAVASNSQSTKEEIKSDARDERFGKRDPGPDSGDAAGLHTPAASTGVTEPTPPGEGAASPVADSAPSQEGADRLDPLRIHPDQPLPAQKADR